jgi:GNAT superfamily N-acetyltransferase
MNLEFKRFQGEYYSEYASWFVDLELNRQLGPMDNDWLEAVLSEPESEGFTWAVFRGAELVAVVEVIFGPNTQAPTVIASVAVRPDLRRQGLGTAVLQKILSLGQIKGRVEHRAYVSFENQAARRYMEKLGFVPVASIPDDHGYIEFRYGGT